MKSALAAAAATGVQVGAALVATEVIVAEVGAGRLGFLRYAIALMFLLVFVLFGKTRRIPRRDLGPVALIGIGQFGVLIALLNIALLHTSSARVSLIFATLPLMTIAVGWLTAPARLDVKELGAIFLTFLGIAALLGADAFAGEMTTGDLVGFAAAGGATLTGAVCSSFYRPYLEAYGVVAVSAVAMAASLVPLGLMGLLEGPPRSPWEWAPETLALIAFIGLSSGLGFMMWLYALASLDAAIVTAFLALSPLTATGLSVMLLSEDVTLGLIVALALVIAGLLVMASSSLPLRRGAGSGAAITLGWGRRIRSLTFGRREERAP